MNIHLHCFSPAPGDVGWSAFFAIALDMIPMERMGRAYDEGAAANRWLESTIDFLNATHTPALRRTLAYRWIAKSGEDQPARGEVRMCLFGKVENPDKMEACAQARLFARELLALLAGVAPHHSWRAVTDEIEFNSLWQPFNLDDAWTAEIRRREERVPLESLRSRPVLGMGRNPAGTHAPEVESLFVVHPFLPRAGTWERLLRILVAQSQPVIFQASLSPTYLTPHEWAALAAEMAKAEDAVRRSERGRGVPGPAELVHVQQAETFIHSLLSQQLKLRDAPFQLHLGLASPSPLPRSLIEAVGVEITHPIPQTSDTVNCLRGGGYDVAIPGTDQEAAVARENVRILGQKTWGKTEAPDALARYSLLVDAVEAAGAFRIPYTHEPAISGIEVGVAREHPPPRGIAELAGLQEPNRLHLGVATHGGTTRPVFLAEADRRQHCYIMGQTGTGKTTLLKTMILSDVNQGRGVAVLDPHGDLFDELLGCIPASRRDDVILLDPMDIEYPAGLNLLECAGEDDRHFIVRELRSIMERLMRDQYQHQAAEYTGPAFYQHMQMNLLLAMSNPLDPGTLLEFHQIYQSKDYWKRWLPLATTDAQLRRWVEGNLPNIDYMKRGSENNVTWGEYLGSKFDDFVFDPKLRLIFGQKRSTLDVREIMDQGKILLVNLAKGQLAESNARFLGMVLMAKLQAAAMSRADLPPKDRRMFYVYVDEFQALATGNFVSLFSEARKFGVGLILANQFLTQIDDPRILRGIIGNVGTTICFRTGREDAEHLEPLFDPLFDKFDLANLPNWEAVVKTTCRGDSLPAFTLHTRAVPQPADAASREAVIASSRRRHGRPRGEVESEIQRSISGKTEPADHDLTRLLRNWLATFAKDVRECSDSNATLFAMPTDHCRAPDGSRQLPMRLRSSLTEGWIHIDVPDAYSLTQDHPHVAAVLRTAMEIHAAQPGFQLRWAADQGVLRAGMVLFIDDNPPVFEQIKKTVHRLVHLMDLYDPVIRHALKTGEIDLAHQTSSDDRKGAETDNEEELASLTETTAEEPRKPSAEPAPPTHPSEPAVRLPVMRNGQWGYVDGDGEVAIPCQFSNVRSFDPRTGTAWVAVSHPTNPEAANLWGRIDPKGRWVIPARFTNVEAFDPVSGMAPAISNEEGTDPLAFALWGLIRQDGSWATDRVYTKITPASSSGLRGAKLKKGAWGVLDAQGTFCPMPDAIDCREFLHDSPFVLARDKTGGWGLVGEKGQWKLPPEYGNPDCNDFPQCTAWWLPRRNGHESKPQVLENGTSFEVADLTKPGPPTQWVLVNAEGDAFPCPALAIDNPLWLRPFIKGRNFVRVETPDHRAGLLRPDGTWLHTPVAKNIRRWSEEQQLIVASPDGIQWGWLDFDGNWVIEPQFESLGLPHSDTKRAFAKKGGSWCGVDLTGKVVSTHPWSDADPTALSGTHAVFPAKATAGSDNNNELWGLANIDGSWAVEPEYSEIRFFDDANRLFRAYRSGEPRRMVIIGPDGTVYHELPEGEAIRTATFSEPADGWIAIHLELAGAAAAQAYRTLYIQPEKKLVISEE